MSRVRKFNFLPFKERRLDHRSLEKDFQPYVNISRKGMMTIPKRSLEKLHIDARPGRLICIKLFIDQDTRAIGFKFVDSPGKKEDGYRLIKLTSHTPKTAKNPSVSLNVAIGSMLLKIGKWSGPLQKLPIEKYIDNDTMLNIGKLHYVTIPKVKNA